MMMVRFAFTNRFYTVFTYYYTVGKAICDAQNELPQSSANTSPARRSAWKTV